MANLEKKSYRAKIETVMTSEKESLEPRISEIMTMEANQTLPL